MSHKFVFPAACPEHLHIMRACVFLLTCLAAATAAAAVGDFAPPRFTVSLDEAPEHRWDGALTTMNASLHAALDLLLRNPEYKIGLGVVQALAKADAVAVADWFPDEQWRELQGISRLTGIAPELLAGVDAIYDLTAGGGARASTSFWTPYPVDVPALRRSSCAVRRAPCAVLCLVAMRLEC